MLHLFLELYLEFLLCLGILSFGKIDRVIFSTLQPFLLMDTPCHELIYVVLALYTVLYCVKCIMLWNSTLDKVLNETLIMIKYIIFGSFPLDIIDVVLQHLMVILK
jgi:hypothetical protein